MKKKINLIYRSKSEFKEKFLHFVYYYLRYILVIVQITVIFVFFNKIRTDQEIIDLDESINQKNEIITVSKPLIEQFLYYRQKMEAIEKIDKNQKLLEVQLEYLLSSIPKEIVLTGLIYNKGSFTVTGYSIDPENIRIFYEKLKRENRFNGISLSNLKKNIGNYNFLIILDDWQNESSV